MPLGGASISTTYRAVFGTYLETTEMVFLAAKVTAESLWVFTLNQTVAQPLGSKVMAQHLQPTHPQQAAAAPPTSLPSYTLRLLLLVAARSPLRPLQLALARALVRVPQPKRLRRRPPLAFALLTSGLALWRASLRLWVSSWGPLSFWRELMDFVT